MISKKLINFIECRKNEYRDTLFSATLRSMVKSPVGTVMDIGCGANPQRCVVATNKHYLVDPMEQKSSGIPCGINICGTWEDALKIASEEHIDTVLLFDVVEHLDKHRALALLDRTVELAERVVIFTPKGFMPQEDGVWNTHRSGWEPQDFKGNWKIKIFGGFHTVDFTGRKLCQPRDAILAVHTKVGVI